MYQSTKDAFTPAVLRALCQRAGVAVDELVDLNGFENFVYGCGDRVLRVTHESHRSAELLLGELAFLSYLAANDAAVSVPLTLPDGELLTSHAGFHAALFSRAKGESYRQSEAFPADMVRRWGQTIGCFHRLAADYQPVHIRPDWRGDENHQFARRIPANQVAVLQQADALMIRLAALPVSDRVFGMIHSDAHPGNFLDDGNKLTMFDFDDCLLAWFGYDVATILFGAALQPWISEHKREQQLHEFLSVFLSGYAQEYDPVHLMWPHMSDFLKLREFSLYGVIHAFMNPVAPSFEMARRFMQGRETALAEGRSLITLDFGRYG